MSGENLGSKGEGQGPGFNFDVAEKQFEDPSPDTLAGVAIEGFGLASYRYPAYKSVHDNKISEHRWAGQPNTV